MAEGHIDTDRSMFPRDIILDNDLADVSELGREWHAVSAVVVRITTPRTTASGFFIAPDRVITNHHVITSPDALRHAGVRRGFVRGSEGERVKVAAKGFFQTSKKLDYTIFTVVPVAGIEPLALDGAVAPVVGDDVYVIGHPDGGAMRFPCSDGAVVHIDPPVVEYRADTLAGSSGAPVMLVATRALVAMHNFGDDDRDDSNRGVLASAIAADLGSAR